MTEWVQLGLLDHARRRGTGRGSRAAVWSENQAELFWQLLAKRAAVKRLADLAVLPLWVWLVYGDEYVPLRQARCALRTWAFQHIVASTARVRRTVQLLAPDVRVRKVPPGMREELVEILANLSSGARDLPDLRERLRAALQEFYGPSPGSREVEGYLSITEARIAGATPFANKSDASVFADRDLLDAREVYRTTWADYAQDSGQPEPALLSEQVQNSCLQFVTLLGYRRLGRTSAPPGKLHRSR